MPENYTYVSRGTEQWASIMITKGEYEGVIYQYGRVSVAKEEELVINILENQYHLLR